MLEILRSADWWLFRFINGSLSNDFFDYIMPTLTDLHKIPIFAYGIFPLGLALWIYRKRGTALKMILALGLCVAVADGINTRVLKPSFQRSRPPNTSVEINLRTKRFGSYSMPSNHAANMFATMGFLALTVPHLKIVFLSFAGLIAFSRVYVGVHFPADVIVGGLLGLFYAFLISRLYFKWTRSRQE